MTQYQNTYGATRVAYDGYLGTLFTSEVSGGCAATPHIGSTCHINWANLFIIIVLRGATMCGNTRKHIRNDNQEIYSELMYQIMLQCHDMIWRHRFVTLSTNDPCATQVGHGTLLSANKE